MYIKPNFKCLPTEIKRHQNQNLLLFKSIQITEKISEIFRKLQGQHSNSIKTKFDSVHNNNLAGYKINCKISEIISGRKE